MHAHADIAQSMWVSAAVVRMKGVLRNKEAYAKDKVCVCLCGGVVVVVEGRGVKDLAHCMIGWMHGAVKWSNV